MRLGPGDVFGVEAFVGIDRGVDAAHDLGRTGGKAAAPQRARRFARVGHRPLFQAECEDEAMKWNAAAVLLILLAAPGTGMAAERESDMPDRTRLGEFVPSSQPFP